MDIVNERNGSEFKLDFVDAYGSPAIPSTVHWRLDCETSQRLLQDFTEANLTSTTDESGVTVVTGSFDLPASLNTIQDNRNWKELKTLLVVADKDATGEYSETYQYYVKNLRGRS